MTSNSKRTKYTATARALTRHRRRITIKIHTRKIHTQEILTTPTLVQTFCPRRCLDFLFLTPVAVGLSCIAPHLHLHLLIPLPPGHSMNKKAYAKIASAMWPVKVFPAKL